jgi:hypothetical protein
VLAVAGCGGTSSLSRDEAMKTALDAASEQVADPSSNLYHHRLQFQSTTQTGDVGWLVRLADRTSGGVVCVRIATTPGAVTPSTNVDFTTCASHRGHARPATPPPSV